MGNNYDHLIEHFNVIKNFFQNDTKFISAFDEKGNFIISNKDSSQCESCILKNSCIKKINIFHNPYISAENLKSLSSQGVTNYEYTILINNNQTPEEDLNQVINNTLLEVKGTDNRCIGYLMESYLKPQAINKKELLEETLRNLSLSLSFSKIISFKYDIVTKIVTIYNKGNYKEISWKECETEIHPDDLPFVNQHIQNLINGTKRKELSIIRVKHPEEKEYRYVESCLQPLMDQNGKICAILGTQQDRTEKYLQEIKLERIRQHLREEQIQERRKEKEVWSITRLALRTYGINIWRFDLQSKHFSPILTEHNFFLSHRSYEEIKGYLLPESIPVYENLYVQLSTGKIESANAVLGIINPQNGQINYHQNAYAVLRNDKGEIIAIIGAQKDITKEIYKNKELLQYKINTTLVNEISHIILWEYDLKKQQFDTKGKGKLNNGGPMTLDVFKQYIHPEDYSIIEHYFEAMNNKTEYYPEITLRAIYPGNIEYSYIAIDIAPIKDKTGNITGYTGLKRDITEQKHYQIQLEDKNAELNQILLMSNIIPFIWRPDCDQIFIAFPQIKHNHEVFHDKQTIFSYKEILNCTHPDDRENINKVYHELSTGKEEKGAFTSRYDAHKKFNHIYSIKLRPFKYDKDERAFIGFMQDITEHETMTKQLISEKLKAQESERLKSLFLANMSHEIRTPLNAIIGFSSMLEETDDPEERKEFSEIININNDLLLKLIDDIIELSRIEAGRAERKPQDFDLSELFKQSYTMHKKQITNENVELLLDIPSKPLIVYLDQRRVFELLNNFLSNANKYTEKGHIKMGYREISDNKVKVYVEDTGCGISKENQKKIFNRFEKLDSFKQGAGLGMAICKAYLDEAKGDIGVDSEEGKGSTFWAIYSIR